MSCPQCDTAIDLADGELCPACLLGFMNEPPDPDLDGTDDPLVGHELGSYRLVKLLGRGGMGLVYEALHKDLNRRVALKMLAAGATARPQEIQRFLSEARASAKLRHPDILPVYEVSSRAGCYYFTTDIVDGEPLSKRIPGMKPEDAARLLARVARAIDYAHGQGIIHRDIKPSNILIDAGGNPKVMDFGIAKDLSSEAALTLSGMTIGSPSYMSPEQAAGRVSAIGPASDVYSLGAVLYECLTGAPPYTGKTSLEIVQKVLNEDPAPMRSAHRDLETVTIKAMARAPEARYASAAALADDLERVAAGEPIRARRPSITYRATKLARRHRAPVAVLAVGLLVLGGFLWELARTRREWLGELREKGDLHLEAALAHRRAGELDAMKGTLPRLEELCARVMREFPDSPEPHHQLGRMYRALMQDDRALVEQNAALEKDPDFAPSLYEKAILLSYRYVREGDTIVWEATGHGNDWPLHEVVLSVRFHRNPDRALLGEIQQVLERLERTSASLGEAQRLSARGHVLWARGEHEEALPLLREARTLDRRLEEAWWTEVQALLALNRAEEAEAVVRESLEIDRGFAPFMIAFAEICALSRRDDEALEAYQRCIDAEPGYPVAYERRARLREAQGEWDLALADYARAVELAPARTDLYMNRVAVQLRTRRLEGALADLNAGIARGGQGAFLASLYDARALLKSGLRDYRGAVEDLTRAMTHKPGDAGYHRKRAILRARLGEHDGALEDGERALTLEPGSLDAYVTRAVVHYHRRDWDAAMADLEAAALLAPDWSRPFFYKGYVWSGRGDYGRAIEEYTRALDRDEQLVLARIYRGTARAKSGDLSGAIADWEASLGGLFEDELRADVVRNIARARRAIEEKTPF